MKHYLLFALAATMAACTSQPVQEDPASTVINADGTVTFNYRNDNAKDVKVSVQFAGQHDMLKDSISGLWTCTLGPAAPDMYPYCFIVDGVSIMDDQNPQFFPNEGFKNSLLDIPGQTPLIHSIQNVPHGNVDYVNYYSKAIGCYNNVVVYTPPTYNENADSYPVFYLISGTTDTEEVYYKVGRMNYILDNLIAQGEAQEMIVVLPYGNPMKLSGQTGGAMFQDSFSKDLINDLMPYVESHYRTINDAEHRAIGGFSRGGNQGLMNGLLNLDKFSYLCSYSSFTSTALPNVYDNAKDTNSKINLFWAGVGTDDFLYGTARDYTEFLDQKGITCVKEYTTDKFGHTWMNAKHFLDKTYRLLFNKDASAAAMANAEPTKAKTGEEQDFTPSVMARLFPKPIVSPEFDGNNVTFRIKAPNATSVKLEGEMLAAPMAMTCDSDGVWSATIEDLIPEIYCYNFDVDGTKVCDAQNMYLAPDKGFKRSVLNMPNAPYSVNAAKLDYTPVTYQSKTAEDGTTSIQAIVAPPAKETILSIALVAGPNDTFESWFKIAHANLILDQMIASGECKPCVLILSDTAVANATVTLNSSYYKNWAEARKTLVDILKSL